MSGGGEYKTKSTLDSRQQPVAKAMFEILKANLAKGSKAYPGSAGSRAFSPQGVQQSYREFVGNPLQKLYNDSFSGLIGPDAKKYAQGRFGESMNILSSKAALRGEEQAYGEWLRTQPEGQPMSLGQSFIGQPFEYMYQVPTREAKMAQAIDTGINTAMAAFGMGTPGQARGQYGPGENSLQQGPWGPGSANYSAWPMSSAAMEYSQSPNPWGQTQQPYLNFGAY